MTIAVSVWSTFDGRVARHGVGAGVALAAIRSKTYRHQRLRAGHYDVRNAVRRPVPNRTKVRMQPVIDANAPDQIRRVRIHRRVRDVLVPRIVRREKPLAVKTGARPEIRLACGL